jgi:NADPH2:quinone reductase
MVKAIRVHEFGGPEVMRWEDVDPGRPGPGQVLLRQRAVGLNFIDTYHRSGLYPNPLPLILGSEGAGEVVALGEGVTNVRVGDRVAYSMSLGAYSEERLISADKLVVLPHDVSFDLGAVMMLKGLTAEYLLHGSFEVKPGHVILVHAAAGGVGQILCQWAKAIGATVIGTVGSFNKVKIAKACGADHVIVSDAENLVARVDDGIGRATFPASLDCLRPHGTFVSFGSASGPIGNFDLTMLTVRGSLYATRPTLGTFTATREDLLSMTERLLAALRTKKVRIDVSKRFPLSEVAAAHQALEGRQTSGSAVLIV